MIAFPCPKCGKQYNLKPEFAGRKTTCAGCKKPLMVPGPETESAKSPDAQGRISFSCTKCGMKFNLLSEFAGRKTTCPSCKEPLVVPSPDTTAAYVPSAGQIDGPASSLAQVHVDAGVTLSVAETSGHSSVQNLLAGKGANSTRYVIDKELARGGMGAVLRAVDCDIRREVAVKYLLDQTSAINKLRFVEEAQITGQLEHPNIVPIHELGVDAQKRIFFAMKMVNGRSLAQILALLRDEPKEAEKEYGLNRLLNIFTNVCNALAYAHSRGVVHRDLKPANIMVGDFGEVYVMDWGLAKVLDQSASLSTSPPVAIPVAAVAVPFGDGAIPLATTAPPMKTPVESPSSSAPGSTSFSAGSGKVVTSRELDADLTQAGAVLGTPVYMPPEQAAGRIQDIDERSDIYSMGAILYEMLTLKPPIDKAGGFWPIVLRVSQGQIQAPELKAPERAQAGRIPVELSAVAMKALAKEKANRYQNVESLRKDIERFLEGRSVSARRDTIREMATRLVKRNKGVSIATSSAALILAIVGVWSLVAVLTANARTLSEQAEKEKRTREAVPAFLKAARQAVEHRELDDAMAQVSVALDYDADNADALLLKGQLLVARKEFAAATKELNRYVQLRPGDEDGAKLAKLCAAPDTDSPGVQESMGNALVRQKQPALAVAFFQSSEKQLEIYRKQLYDGGWPGENLSIAKDRGLVFYLNAQAPLDKYLDLSPFRGIPLSELILRNIRVQNLDPLRGMPLTSVYFVSLPFLKDLTPLRDTRLKNLNLEHCPGVKDLGPLQGLRLSHVSLVVCPEIQDLSPLLGMRLVSFHITAFPNSGVPSKVDDLSPLRGMPIEEMTLIGTNVTSIEPLRGMPLQKLHFHLHSIKDFSPIKGIPLKELTGAAIADLSLLEGMPLHRLESVSQVKDLSPLRAFPLRHLHIGPNDLTPLRGMELESITLLHGSIKDYKGLDLLRSMKSLRQFGSIDTAEFWRKVDAGEIK